MERDKKSPITRDVIRKSNSGRVRARNSESGQFVVSVKWGYKTYTDTITDDQIHKAFRVALDKDSNIAKKV